MAKHRFLRALLLLGFAVVVAACSGTEDTVAIEAAPAAEGEATEVADTDPSDDSAAIADDDTMGDESGDDTAETDGSDADNGGTEETAEPASGPPPSLPPEEASTAAEQNIPNLQVSDDVRDTEVVSVYDGSATSLREVVTGDRPVLLWFWAPH